MLSTETLGRKLTKGGETLQEEPQGAGEVKISTASIPPSILHRTVHPLQAECLMSVCAVEQQQHGRVWRRRMSRSQEEEDERRQDKKRGVAAELPKCNHPNEKSTEGLI